MKLFYVYNLRVTMNFPDNYLFVLLYGIVTEQWKRQKINSCECVNHFDH